MIKTQKNFLKFRLGKVNIIGPQRHSSWVLKKSWSWAQTTQISSCLAYSLQFKSEASPSKISCFSRRFQPWNKICLMVSSQEWEWRLLMESVSELYWGECWIGGGAGTGDNWDEPPSALVVDAGRLKDTLNTQNDIGDRCDSVLFWGEVN